MISSYQSSSCFVPIPQSFDYLLLIPRSHFLNSHNLQNLSLIPKETAKPPVFIDPVLMHQSKDWKTYSKSADSLALERPSLKGILSCGNDGEKPLIDGFKQNFCWAIVLRCSIPIKKYIRKILDDRSIRHLLNKNSCVTYFKVRNFRKVRVFGIFWQICERLEP